MLALAACSSTKPIHFESREAALHAAPNGKLHDLFLKGIYSFRKGRFEESGDAFSQARKRYLETYSGPSEYLHGVEFYLGRVAEQFYDFDTAEDYFAGVPPDSAYGPQATHRMEAIRKDTDGDGYTDAWEEVEGFNPDNPLSHP